jgi:glycosyltransferase involved in cell wall biosynthesis
MSKIVLGIVNSSPINMTYGGVAPFIKNLDTFLQTEYDVVYILLPSSLTKINFIPRRLIFLIYLFLNKRKLRSCDIILSHVPEGSYIASYVNVPFIHIFHGNFNAVSKSRFWYGKYFMPIFDGMDKRILRKASHVYTVGDEKNGIPKILNPIYHSVQLKSIGSRSGFIFSGRLEKVKGVDRLLKVYSKLPESIRVKNPFYIAGIGTQESNLRKLVSSLNLDNQVIFLGNLKNEEMVETDSSKKMMIMASSQEGLPMAIAEALSVGTPVVATDTGDISRIIKNNENGFMLPIAFSDDEYVESIMKILNDYDRFSRNAFESAKIFRAETVAASLIKDINKLVQGN